MFRIPGTWLWQAQRAPGIFFGCCYHLCGVSNVYFLRTGDGHSFQFLGAHHGTQTTPACMAVIVADGSE